MQKSTIRLILFLIGFVILLSSVSLPVLAEAKTSISFFPAKNSYSVGTDFYVWVMLNPHRETIYTTEVHISYPVNLMEIHQVDLASGWMSPIQHGYQLNSQKGELTIIGGFPNGFSLPRFLARIAIHAQQIGKATLNVGKETIVLNSLNKNVFDGVSHPAIFSFLKKKPVIYHPVSQYPAASKSTLSSSLSKEESVSPVTVKKGTTSTKETVSTSKATATSSSQIATSQKTTLLATIGNFSKTRIGMLVLLIILGVLLILLILVRYRKFLPLWEKIREFFGYQRDVYK